MRKHAVLVGGVLLLTLPAASALRAGGPAVGLRRQAEEALPRSSNQARSSQPPADELAAYQGLVQAQDPQQRLARVEEFLMRYPDSSLRSRTYAAGAEAFRMQSNFEKAVEYGEKALELSARDPFILILLADALSEGAGPMSPDYQQRLSRAEKYARRAIELLPGLVATAPQPRGVPEERFLMNWDYIEAQPHATLGFILLRRQDYAAAEEELKKATELNRIRPNAVDFIRLGLSHMRQQEWIEAKAALERCVEIGGSAAVTAQLQLEEVRKKLQQQGNDQPAPPEKE